MNGQTTIEPCAICGEPSVEQRVIEPGDAQPKFKGSVRIHKMDTLRWLCAKHVASVDRDAKWQERAAARRSAQRKALKKRQEASTLFDKDHGTPPGWAA